MNRGAEAPALRYCENYVPKPPLHARLYVAVGSAAVSLRRRRARASARASQKNFLVMLNPMYQSSVSVPPRASWAIVVPMPLEKLNWNT